MREISLYRRLGRKYRGGWAYLDGEEFVTDAIVLRREGEEIEDEGYCYYRGSATILLADSVPYKIACEAIRDSFRVNNCTHEYDCCGCLSIGVDEITVLDTDFYEVSLSGSRNY